MYLTQSNLNKLISTVEISPNEILNLPNIQNFISEDELSYISKSNKFFSSKDKLSLIFLKKIEPKVDTYTKLFEGIKPSYHLNKNCPKLKNAYKNLYIPAEIKARGHDEVERFREYVKRFPFDDLLKESTFIAIKAHFNFHDPHFTTEQFRNSGVREIDFLSLTINEIEKILEQVTQQLDSFANQSPEHKKVFQLIYRSPSDIIWLTKNHNPTTAQIAKDMSEIKKQLLLAQVALFQKSLNFDNETLDRNVLEKNGFVPCGCIKQLI